MSRYIVMAGGIYLFFYSAVGRSLVKQDVPLKPSRQLIQADIQLSVLSAVCFALCAALILSAYDGGQTLLYASVQRYGLWYLGVSFIAVLILQDTYFYFIHRLFHHPLLFQRFHRGHHRSVHPTPWTSFAFDLPEAIVQGGFFVGLVFIVPLHFITLVAVLMTMTIWAIANHLGFELVPAAFRKHWLGRWFIGATHHSTHHRKYTLHYGLYFTVWDTLLGTQDPNYDRELFPNRRAISSSYEQP